MGTIAGGRLGAEPDVANWANDCALNSMRIEPTRRSDLMVQRAVTRLADEADRGLPRLAELAHEPLVRGYGRTIADEVYCSD